MEDQAQGFTSESRDDRRYFVRKRRASRQKNRSSYAKFPSERAPPFQRSWDAGAGRMRPSGSKDSRVVSQERRDADAELLKLQGKLQGELANVRTIATQEPVVKHQEEERTDAQLYVTAVPEGNLDHGRIGRGDAQTIDSQKDESNAPVHDILVTSADHSRRSSNRREDSSERTTSRVKAMETMLLYRAMLFACLLATGTDTSDLLWLENRNRIVQVL